MKWQSAKKQSPLSRVRSHKFISFLIFIVLLIVGIFIYQKIALEINKRDFQKARSAIDSLYSIIVKEVGRPDDSKISNSCNIVREEFSDGPTYCFISTDFTYPISDITNAQTLYERIKKIIGEHSDLFKPIKLTDGIRGRPVGNDLYQSTNDTYKSGGMFCTFSYVFDTPKLSSLTINSTRDKVFQINLGCSGKVIKALFNLEN